MIVILIYLLLLYPASIFMRDVIYPFIGETLNKRQLIIDTFLWPVLILLWMVCFAKGLWDECFQ